MSKPVFLDPGRKRWKRLRLVTDPLGIVVTLAIAFLAFSLSQPENLKQITNPFFPDIRRPFKALKENGRRMRRHPVTTTRRNPRPASQVPLNSSSDEGVRAAFYVPWDEASYASLKEYSAQIDLLFPEWLHVITPDGRLQAVTESGTMYDVIEGNVVHSVDPRHKVMQFLRDEKAQTEVFPLVNNYDSASNQWLASIGTMMNDPAARERFRTELMRFLLGKDQYHGVSLDFEEIPLKAQPGYNALVEELSKELHSRGMKLYLNLPSHDTDFDYPFLAARADGLILMDYDQHAPGMKQGPIAAQDWYIENLRLALKEVPLPKIIAGIGNYGYDWEVRKGAGKPSHVSKVSAEEAWLHAQESDDTIEFDPDALNPRYAYMDDETKLRHEVWFLDAVTALNQMRAARTMGINTFALWRLGSEDGSLWAVWDRPSDSDAPLRLRSIPPGQDVDLEGKGEILRIEKTPEWGWREITLDADSQFINSEAVIKYSLPFQVNQYGASKNQVAITFDDGPDPKYTGRILDILKRENANATFFLIGGQAEKFSDLTRRIYAEGHEIGNHTFTHPDISNIKNSWMRLELNSTERLFEAKLGVKPLYFRPPYSIDSEPDTAEQVEPLRFTQDMGYITVGAKLDPNDWRNTPHRTPEQITDDVIRQLTQPHLSCTQAPCANIVLLHDGGGNREATVQALPLIIHQLRAHGFEIVPVSQLIGKTRAEVMPPLTRTELWAARIDNFGFGLYGLLARTIVVVFFLGNILMTSRLLIIGGLAVFDRFRKPKSKSKSKTNTGIGLGTPGEAPWPHVAVLIPAYNEERVIVNTVCSVLASEYPGEKLRVIIIDDGSTDSTLSVAQQVFAGEIAVGKILLLTKPNAGKAEALNFGVAQVRDHEQIFIGIDADTHIAPDAIARLVPHFQDPKVAAVAGNTKVGNRVNLWTRWQALEYITSQNLERRALNALDAVSVVPGALGAWRTAAVRAAGGYQLGTVAEDADLTMSLLERGMRVQYEDRALAFTEAPINANGLMRQRFRWSFGILQSLWKHRGAFHRGGALGWFALPNIAIFQILLPVVSPFIDLMFLSGALAYGWDYYFHPEAANPASFEKLVMFFLIFMVTDFIASVIAFSLERHESGGGEDAWLLSQVWLQRFSYRQLFSIVLYKTLKRAIDGRPFSWDKLERTAAVPAMHRVLAPRDTPGQTHVIMK